MKKKHIIIVYMPVIIHLPSINAPGAAVDLAQEVKETMLDAPVVAYTNGIDLSGVLAKDGADPQSKDDAIKYVIERNSAGTNLGISDKITFSVWGTALSVVEYGVVYSNSKYSFSKTSGTEADLQAHLAHLLNKKIIDVIESSNDKKANMLKFLLDQATAERLAVGTFIAGKSESEVGTYIANTSVTFSLDQFGNPSSNMISDLCAYLVILGAGALEVQAESAVVFSGSSLLSASKTVNVLFKKP